ncbi:hypothetical protein SNEBB_007105 [Seison nebaliae]|nr:hypothetical protein SNEBB_007105 [Seison nebaliae]
MVDGGGEFYSFAYYPNVEVLNIGILINSVRHDPIDVTPFQPGYYADLGNETMDELREDLTEKKITPKVIHLGFYPKGRMRIHEMTYISFSAFLHRIKHLQMEELPPPDFEIFIQSQRFTMPKINDNENVHYSFPIENGDADFQLKAVSFFLQYEYVTFPKDLIPVENPSPSVHNCTNKFLRKRETYANILGEGHLDFLDNYIKKYIKYFYAMCNAALDVEFYKTHVYNQGPHTFSINRRDDGWVLMNDQHSFEIDNIGQMSEMLKNEVVDAIVLEIETGKRLKE